MNLIQINNLKKLVSAGYPHISLNYSDLNQLIIVPAIEKKWYEFRGRTLFTKRGFFHGEKTTVTTVWSNHTVKPNHIKIAEKLPTSADEGPWSEAFSFEEEGADEVIARMMKLKIFW